MTSGVAVAFESVLRGQNYGSGLRLMLEVYNYDVKELPYEIVPNGWRVQFHWYMRTSIFSGPLKFCRTYAIVITTCGI